MEAWDILDPEGRPTGRRILRGEPLGPEERHLVVHVHLVNRAGHFLIQKRSMSKAFSPGAWDVTCGAVLAGEESLQGALREVREELGLRLEPSALAFVARLRRVDSFVDVWLGWIDVEISRLVMQEEEVDALRFVDARELAGLVSGRGRADDGCLALMERLVRDGVVRDGVVRDRGC
jgi:8-oxo-dGTP pyrophosphatase MutT (NUDIX family)